MNTQAHEPHKLEKVREFARKAHGPQMRKFSPEPYIVHPIRVMELCSEYVQSTEILAAALLHDVLEDTKVSKKELLGFLSTVFDEVSSVKILGFVSDLTDLYTHEKYPDWSRKKRKEYEAGRLSSVSAEAQTIKCADILDNCRDVLIQAPDFALKYLSEVKNLLSKMKKADPRLHTLCDKQVQNGLDILRYKNRRSY